MSSAGPIALKSHLRTWLAVILALAMGSPSARSQLICEKTSVNAGVVYTGTLLTQRFVLVNRGNTSIQIIDAKASCGCLAPRLSRRLVDPGENITVELEVNTLSQPAGMNSWSVRLRYQQFGATLETTLQLSAQLVSEVTVEPAALVLLADKAAGHEVAITDTRSRPLKVLKARAGCTALQARVCGPEFSQKGQPTYRILFAVAENYPEGRHDDTLLVTTDDPKYAELRVPVTIIKRPHSRLSATPNEAIVSAPAGQPAPSRIILVRDNNGDRVRIQDITSDDPAVVCTWAEGPNAMATVKIRLDHKRIHTSTFSSAVHVRISSPVQETLTIPVHYTTSLSCSSN